MSSNSVPGPSVCAGGGGDGGSGGSSPPQLECMKEDNRPRTLDELRQISQRINQLPGPELGRLVRIIQRKQPSLNKNPDEFEIDFERLEPSTLGAIEQFLLTLFPEL